MPDLEWIERYAVIQLIRAIRACPTCQPTLYRMCAAHRRAVEAITAPCPDPACPACRPTN